MGKFLKPLYSLGEESTVEPQGFSGIWTSVRFMFHHPWSVPSRRNLAPNVHHESDAAAADDSMLYIVFIWFCLSGLSRQVWRCLWLMTNSIYLENGNLVLKQFSTERLERRSVYQLSAFVKCYANIHVSSLQTTTSTSIVQYMRLLIAQVSPNVITNTSNIQGTKLYNWCIIRSNTTPLFQNGNSFCCWLLEGIVLLLTG